MFFRLGCVTKAKVSKFWVWHDLFGRQSLPEENTPGLLSIPEPHCCQVCHSAGRPARAVA